MRKEWPELAISIFSIFEERHWPMHFVSATVAKALRGVPLISFGTSAHVEVQQNDSKQPPGTRFKMRNSQSIAQSKVGLQKHEDQKASSNINDLLLSPLS